MSTVTRVPYLPSGSKLMRPLFAVPLVERHAQIIMRGGGCAGAIVGTSMACAVPGGKVMMSPFRNFVRFRGVKLADGAWKFR